MIIFLLTPILPKSILLNRTVSYCTNPFTYPGMVSAEGLKGFVVLNQNITYF